MLIGAVFPHEFQLRHGSELRVFFQSLEEAGFDYVMVFDHVAGAPYENLAHLPVVPYVNTSPFYEILVLLGYAAAATRQLELATGVLVLPQRQTLLAAKQLATLDLLSDERLRVGLGVGWNPAEYAALGADFESRGAVLDEQVDLLRSIWTNELVIATGKYHDWESIGISPLPRRQIPLWFGGTSRRALRRVAQVGQGWIPPLMDTGSGVPPDLRALLGVLGDELSRAGRDRADIGLEGRAAWSGSADALEDSIGVWRDLGADRVAIRAQFSDERGAADYADALSAARLSLA